jgi:ribosomal protein S15P/S13E
LAIKRIKVKAKNEISKDFPKFCLVESNNKNHQDLFDTGIKINSSWIPEQIFYLPETAKKIFCMFFEHTMNNLQDKNSLNNYMGVGGRLEVLFEYLDSKNFKKNDDIINFIENTSYNQIYDEFDLKFKKFQKSKTNELNFNMKNSHEKQMNNFNNNMHLMFSDGIKDFIIERIPGSKQIKYADSWIKKLNHIEKLSIKNNFFDQINNIENNSNYTFT